MDLESTTATAQKGGPRRSRTGCITCKIRRVKCDETRPVCNRCIQTGRTCDGYPSAGTPSQHQTRRALAAAIRQLSVVGPASRVLGRPQAADDVACFDFFRVCTASMTASVFPGEKFWCNPMLQAAHAEPAVWRAAVSLGALHRQWEYRNNCLSLREVGPDGSPSRSRANDNDVILFTQQAHKHYLASLSLAKGISDPSMLVILSVALGAAAHLAGKWADSQVHIRAGLRLLREIQANTQATIGSNTDASAGRVVLLPADLEGAAQALERLDAQAMTLSDAASPYDYASHDLNESKRALLGQQDDHLRKNANALVGPIYDLGEAAKAIFRLMRQFFIIADAVTTGALSEAEFEQARLQMVEATSRWEKETKPLICQASMNNLNQAGIPTQQERDQTVLILSLQLYHTTVEVFLLAHASPTPENSLRLPLDGDRNPRESDLDTDEAEQPVHLLETSRRLALRCPSHLLPSLRKPASPTPNCRIISTLLNHKHEPSTLPSTFAYRQTPSQSSPPPSSPEPTSADPSLPTTETRWDALHPYFLRIISLASAIASNTNSPLPFFMSLEPGLAMPLYVTINRCRHPITRRRALGLLKRLNRQEGIWNCSMAARAAGEIVMLEEAGLLGLEVEGDKGDDELLMPLWWFEKGKRDEGDMGEGEGGRLLEQFKERARERVEEAVAAGRIARDGITYWEDGWPNIPEEKRAMIQYPIFRLQEHQLELAMFLVGDMRNRGEEKVAKSVVLDMY